MKSAAEILTEMLAGMACFGSYTFEGRPIECVEAVKRGMKPRNYPFVEGDTTYVLFPPETDEEYERRRLCPRCKVKQRLDALTINAQAN